MTEAPVPWASIVDALFKPDETAWSLCFHTDNDPYGQLVDLRAVTSPVTLPRYWTCSVPGWWLPEMGAIDFGAEQHHVRKLMQEVALDGGLPQAQTVYPPASRCPILLFEVDYLLVGKTGADDATKRMQAEAMAQALRLSGFPASLLVDSGGKSVHIYVRLSDDQAQVQAWRESPAWDRLLELAWTVFGNFDEGVTKQFGRVRLVRTPGAVRENGQPQRALMVGPHRSIAELEAWFAAQLAPEALREIVSRPPMRGRDRRRLYQLRVEKWRRDLLMEHHEGERGTHWMFVSKALAMAGCKQPRCLQPPGGGQAGQWDAAWLWWVSALVFERLTGGWFFQAGADIGERTRWWDPATIRQQIDEQRRFEGYDPQVAALTAEMEAQQAAHEDVTDPRNSEAALPPPPQAVPAGGQPATVQQPQVEQPKKKSGGKRFDPTPFIEQFFEIVKHETLIRCGPLAGMKWMGFDRVWQEISEERLLQIIHHKLMPHGYLEKEKREVLAGIRHHVLDDRPWETKERKDAIAFENGTLYLDPGQQPMFREGWAPEDRIRSMTPCPFNPQAVCPKWQAFVDTVLPDPAQRQIAQELFGYTLMTGQPLQKFFLLLGTGANGKGTFLRVLERLNEEAREAVGLAQLGGQFALGTLPGKRLAVDADCESLTRRDMSENNGVMAVIKSWTGGDPVKVSVKNVQGWTTKLDAKLVLAANKRPKFMDTSKGVWRRLVLLDFAIEIPKEHRISDFDQILIREEMSGIVNWAVQGLLRLRGQGRFTESATMEQQVADYQRSSDSVLVFLSDFVEEDQHAGWFDLRPVYAAYSKGFSPDHGTPPVAFEEFLSRLRTHGVVVGRPTLNEHVHGLPTGVEVRSRHYWCMRGRRCVHQSYQMSTLLSLAPRGGHPLAMAS